MRLWGENESTHIRFLKQSWPWTCQSVSARLTLGSLLLILLDPTGDKWHPVYSWYWSHLWKAPIYWLLPPRNWAGSFWLFCQLPVWCLAHRYPVTVRWVPKGTTYSDQLSMLPKGCSLCVAMAMQQSEAPVRILQRGTTHPSGVGSSPGIVNLSTFICFNTFQIWSLLFTNVCLLTA